jgi:polyisoprenoid-binding protein YceI
VRLGIQYCTTLSTGGPKPARIEEIDQMKTQRIAAAATLGLLGLGSLGWSLTSGTPTNAAPAIEASAEGGSYRVDPTHSSVIFQIKHAGVTNFYGRFNKLTGTWTYDPNDLSTASFEFSIDNESVMTGASDRDDHLKSPDFFNVKQFPTTTFKSTKLIDQPGNIHKLVGDLTLHGETHEITADFAFLGEGSFRGKDIAAFEVMFKINRRDFGMTTYSAADGSDSGGLGNSVMIIVSVEAQKQ